MSEFENKPLGIDFNFDNPVELDIDLEEGNLFSIEKEEEIPEEPEVQLEEEELEEKTPPTVPGEELEETTESTTEEPVATEFPELENFAPTLANLLHEKGHIVEVPEGVDSENFGIEDFWKTVDYNIQKKEEAKFVEGVQHEQQRIVDKLPNLAQDILAYSLGDNLDDEDVFSYMQSLVHSREITSLNPEQAGDAETIVKEYYKQTGWKDEEIITKLNNLIEREELKSEALFLKPKLDEKASQIAQQKVEQQKQLEQYDREMQQNLEQRVSSVLGTGKLKDIPLSKEEVSFLYNAAVNNEIPVRVKGGKKVEMGFAEYLIRKHKYDTQSGNLENLLLGLLVMEHGTDAVEKFVAKKARTKEVNEYTRQMKFSGKKKGGSTQQKQSKSHTGGFIFKQ